MAEVVRISSGINISDVVSGFCKSGPRGFVSKLGHVDVSGPLGLNFVKRTDPHVLKPGRQCFTGASLP